MKHKKGISSLYNVSILKLLQTKQKRRKKMTLFSATTTTTKKDGVVLSVSGEDELDIVLVCKSISSCTHASTHKHFSSADWILFSLFSPSREMKVKERWIWLVLWFPLSLNLPTCSTQWFPTFHRMTCQHPENLLGLIFHFSNRWTDQQWEWEVPTEDEIKTTPPT